ncbi:FAD/NAD(P)-binding domain-containing protein [Rhizoclosmatium globosum]|uniref:FAD/NAD(P)-binding domain-containing protein n=1 Tax=Rhizoclosmatium globosum TaxID=329046 RepID=A0A1Y2BTW1_9FUNG|nr:FAD/NAD(P)-binding domain-containing protein [Rhizoclosmatium globosum]|eukprot:ORY38186.1 FAD/NAD(P)-binding domain-containing protein [Rhizoclosmatium globosum]
MPTAIIIGSGLVGAATALALNQVGIESVLYDQIDLAQATVDGTPVEFGDSGGGIAIQAGGLRVLRSLGVLDDCKAQGIRLPYTTWAKMDGSSPIVADIIYWNKHSGETDPELQAPLQILRSRLHYVLMKACYKAGIKTFVNKKLIDVKQDATQATAYFADGTTATADFLIGADGIHSATRRKVFGSHLTAKFTGEMGHLSVVNLKDHNIQLKETEGTTFYVDRDKKRFVVAYKVSEELGALRVTTFDDPEEEDQTYRPVSDLPKHAGRLADLLHEWGVPAHVETMMRKSFRMSAASVYDLPDMETYRKDRVILIGDAAHGMVPNAGIGLLTGLEDVGTLLSIFKHYSKVDEFDKALDLYSRIRVARGTEAANRARAMRVRGMAASMFGGGFNHFMFRFVVGVAEVTKFIQEEAEKA